MSTSRRTLVTAALAAGGVALALLPAGGASAQPEQSGLADVRQATKQFHDVQVALDAGYRETQHCVPGMGYHYVNPDLVEDPGVDPLAPEVLLYAPSGNGGVRLVGVEWFVVDEDPGTEESIEVVGQELHGPMQHGPLPWHYDLHAYVWKGNPDGVFATSNPSIRCP